jgi:hypothetical protein
VCIEPIYIAEALIHQNTSERSSKLYIFLEYEVFHFTLSINKMVQKCNIENAINRKKNIKFERVNKSIKSICIATNEKIKLSQF